MAPPYMNAHGLVTKIFEKIITAPQPDTFTQDFLKTKLGYDSGSSRPFIPLLKRLGFLQSNGAPSPLYSQFRNPSSRGAAMATAIKQGYSDLYERNEYVHDLGRDQLKNLVVEMTGLSPDDGVVNGIVGTYLALKTYAKFDEEMTEVTPERITTPPAANPPAALPANEARNGGLNLSYTIYLNLPETTNVEVFNAIFRSLKENLLKG